ncbi:tubulin epsilon and delta complex protein 2 [Talpa occidentalis]|uniref:tubulin epsilon and delta complex protein 2 n=1 Tax=Talpa occidentalis TaxID=50954 RepID=UPI00188F1683|nr:tubulin epsilon and delta complex protein 2 [Talpa occidentalis]
MPGRGGAFRRRQIRGAAAASMLPAGCSRRLLAELRGALDACAERQRQLERSLRVCRRLLRAWEPAEAAAPEPGPGPAAEEEDSPAGAAPSPRDLEELELLTRALERAARVRKGVSKAGERDPGPCLKPGSGAAAPASPASAPPRASGPHGSGAPEARPPRGILQTRLPVTTSERRLLSARGQPGVGRPARPPPALRDQQTASPALEAFTLKEKGTLLQLPVAFRKAAAQNSRLWAQLSSTQPSDSAGAAATAKAQFLQKMQASSGRPSPRGPGLSTEEVQAEVGRLQKACSLLKLRMREELVADPADWTQEYRSLLTLEGLQALAGQCLHRLQELRVAVTEQQLESWPEGSPFSAPAPCGGGADPIWSPPLLLYSSTRELQTLAALQLRVATLEQQIHLEKVLMEELLPLVRAPEPPLVLCRAVHSLLCEGGQHFLSVLWDPPAD